MLKLPTVCSGLNKRKTVVVFSEQAYAGGNAEHSTHHFPEALLRSKLCEQADDQVGAGSLSRPGGGKRNTSWQ